MIDSFEMSRIYWRYLKGQSIFEIEHMLTKIRGVQAQEYWNEVLTYLSIRKNGKGSLS